jgi:hypothetical protein
MKNPLACRHPVSRRALVLAVAGMAVLPAHAEPAAPPLPVEVAAEAPGSHLQGQGRLTFLGMHIYDARLWVGPAFAAEDFERQAFALELVYGRSLDGKLIAERSLAEMKKVGTVSDAQAGRWLAQMTRLFPDVDRNDRITGLHRPGELARFFVNGKLCGDVADPEFARLFFGIWLSPRSSEPKLRQALLGTARARP